MGVFRQIFRPFPCRNRHIKNGLLGLKGKNKNRQRGGRDLQFLVRNFHFNFFVSSEIADGGLIYIFFKNQSLHLPQKGWVK